MGRGDDAQGSAAPLLPLMTTPAYGLDEVMKDALERVRRLSGASLAALPMWECWNTRY